MRAKRLSRHGRRRDVAAGSVMAEQIARGQSYKQTVAHSARLGGRARERFGG